MLVNERLIYKTHDNFWNLNVS